MTDKQRAQARAELTEALKAALLAYQQATGEDTGLVPGALLYATTGNETGPLWDSGNLEV